MVNIAKVDTSIRPQQPGKLDRHALQVGSSVSWQSKDGCEKFGHIVKLNPKLAKICTNNGEIWKVDYSLLSQVIEGNSEEIENTLVIEDLGK